MTQEEITALGSRSLGQLPQYANILSKVMKVLSDAEMATLGRADRIGRGEPAEPVVAQSEQAAELAAMREQLAAQQARIAALEANHQPAAVALPPIVIQPSSPSSVEIVDYSDNDSGNDDQTERNRRQFG